MLHIKLWSQWPTSSGVFIPKRPYSSLNSTTSAASWDEACGLKETLSGLYLEWINLETLDMHIGNRVDFWADSDVHGFEVHQFKL